MGALHKELISILESAESKVLTLVARAAEMRNYKMIEEAKVLAERLHQMQSAEQARARNGGEVPLNTRGATSSKKNPSRKKKKQKKKAAYPQFEVRHGALYKIGWSKRNSSEYTHRVPLERAREVIGLLDELSMRAKNIISSDHIFEWLDKRRCKVPSYQVYLVLALLRQERVIVASGRDGYKLPQGIERSAESILRQIERE